MHRKGKLSVLCGPGFVWLSEVVQGDGNKEVKPLTRGTERAPAGQAKPTHRGLGACSLCSSLPCGLPRAAL